jgi:hypothetical protein
MFFKKKQISHKDIGVIIYEVIVRFGLFQQNNPMSYEAFVSEVLELDRQQLPEGYVWEVIFGALFGAGIAIFEKCDPSVAKSIMDGIREELKKHAREIGYSESSSEAADILFLKRQREYNNIFRSASFIPSVLGKQFVLNITAREKIDHSLFPVLEAATTIIWSNRNITEKILREYKVI